MRRFALGALTALGSISASAGEANVLDVRYQQASDGSHVFDVTVHHPADGPDHYADRWEIVAPDGAILAIRALDGPKGGQPFVTSLAGIEIGEDLTDVTVRAHDVVHGHGGMEVTVALKGSL